MSILKSIWSDLVEKRLWPVAVVLIVALAAVPVVLAGGGQEPATDEPVPAPATAQAAAAGGDRAQVSLSAADPARVERGGRLRNPFKAPPKAPEATVPTTATPAPAGGDKPAKGGLTDERPQADAPGGPAAPAPGDDPKPKPKTKTEPKVIDLHRVTVRFSGGSREPRLIDDLAPLAPLPDAQDPALVFLGVKEDGRTLRFLTSADVLPLGEDPPCKPSKSACEAIELREGDDFEFQLVGDDGAPMTFPSGEVKSWRIKVVRVERTGAGPTRAITARKARAARRARAAQDTLSVPQDTLTQHR
jgi:hypothetical protein